MSGCAPTLFSSLIPEAREYLNALVADRVILRFKMSGPAVDLDDVVERVDENVARIQVTGVKICAAGEELTDELERRIAFTLFRFGKWQHETPAESDPDGRIHSLSLTAAPRDEDAEVVKSQGFAIVGVLSSMYSALFNEVTLNESGAVQRLDHHSEPGEFGSLIPSEFFERSDRSLRLWVLELQPSDS